MQDFLGNCRLSFARPSSQICNWENFCLCVYVAKAQNCERVARWNTEQPSGGVQRSLILIYFEQ